MTVAQDLVTADMLLRMPDDGARYELIEGESRRISPAGFQHGRIIMNIATPLDTYARAYKLGIVCAAETGFVLASNPDTVRAADVAFIRHERIEHEPSVEGYWPGAPDLAVEVISPHDLYTEVDEKVAAWLDAGTRMVVVVNPRRHLVTLYHSHTQITLLREVDILRGGDIVPGWQLAIADIFSEV